VRNALGVEWRPVTGRRWRRPFMAGRRNASEDATMRKARNARQLFVIGSLRSWARTVCYDFLRPPIKVFFILIIS
jgi:hypothetical protein